MVSLRHLGDAGERTRGQTSIKLQFCLSRLRFLSFNIPISLSYISHYQLSSLAFILTTNGNDMADLLSDPMFQGHFVRRELLLLLGLWTYRQPPFPLLPLLLLRVEWDVCRASWIGM